MKAAYFNGTMKKEHDGVTRVLYRLIDEINKTNEIDPLFISAIVPPKSEQMVDMFKVPSFAFPFYKDYRVAYPGTGFFERRLQEFKPDIIHINSPCPLGAAAVKYGNKNNIPVVATYHTHFPSYAKYYKVNLLEMHGWNYLKNLYNRCEAVYVPSIPIFEELVEHGFETVEFLPHGVDSSIFNPGCKSDSWKSELGIEGKFTLLYAGRLVWEKDLATLAESYKKLTEQRDDIKFVLAGDGPIKGELKKIMPDALFLGQQTIKDLAVSFASSDIFIFPSSTETFGNVTLEAMAAGLPPICVNEGGAGGIIIDGETGFIAESRNAGDIVEKINILLDNPELRKRLSENAINFAQGQSWGNIFERMFESYKYVISKYRLEWAA